jgi:hypothetical protein
VAGPGKPGRRKGGHNSKPTFKKPKLGHGPKRPHPNSRKNLRKPWTKGQRGNPHNKNLKGPRVWLELHKLYNTLAGEVDPAKKMIRMEAWFFRNYGIAMKGKAKDALVAIDLLNKYSVGSPAQTVKIMPAVDINIGLAPEIAQPDLAQADNVAIIRGDSEKIISEFHGEGGKGNGDGNGNGDMPKA